MTTTARYPVAPAVTPPQATLISAATVTDEFAWLDGKDLFQSYNCLTFGANANFCAPNTLTLTQNAGWISGFRFAGYGGVTCKAPGLDQAAMKAAVGAAFDTGESTAIEKAVMATRFIADPGGNWAAPTDITPVAGAVKPATGIAMLEGHAAVNYVGTPTLHIPKVIASLVLGVNGAMFEQDMLRTRLGSKIAAGAGYDYPNNGPTGAAAPVGEKWLYATGEVLIGRGDMTLLQAFAQGNNDVTVLAERGYIVAVDCYAAAVRVLVNG